MATREDSRETLSLHNIKGLRIKIFDAQNKVKSSHQIIVGDTNGCRVELEMYSVDRRLESAPTSSHQLSSTHASTSATPIRPSAAGSVEPQRPRTNANTQRNPATTPSPLTTLTAQDASYCRLLDTAIRAARNATFPRKEMFETGRFGMASQSQNSSTRYITRSAFRGLDGLEYFNKIGAAGELYAFEFLSGLHLLTGWGLDNWTSKNRDHVMVHSDYANIKPQPGRNGADFRFRDAKGELTTLLIEQGYLSRDEWQRERPLYSMDVNTTIEGPESSFYIDTSQYMRMTGTKWSESHRRRSEVYVILRVYEIEGAGTALKIFVDPGQMCDDKVLLCKAFGEDTWSVVPG